MHELGVTFYVVRDVKKVAEENNVKKIDYVTLEIGEVSGVIHEAVTEHAKIYIETLEAITYCEDCKGQYRTIDYGKKCPYCHSEHTYLLKGNEFNIKEIGIYEDSGA